MTPLPSTGIRRRIVSTGQSCPTVANGTDYFFVRHYSSAIRPIAFTVRSTYE
jgi:hypothetical protein